MDLTEMGAALRDASHAGQLIPALEGFWRDHHRLRGICRVLDGGGSQVAGETIRDLAGCGGG